MQNLLVFIQLMALNQGIVLWILTPSLCVSRRENVKKSVWGSKWTKTGGKGRFEKQFNIMKTRVAQWWKHLPPTNVLWVQIPTSMPYLGWVCGLFFPLLREVFLWVLQFSPPLYASKFEFYLECTDICKTVLTCNSLRANFIDLLLNCNLQVCPLFSCLETRATRSCNIIVILNWPLFHPHFCKNT